MAACKSVKLNSGFSIPEFGLGTWESKPGEVGNAVKVAVESGYRLIDCAYIYQNEEEVGATLKELFEAGIVKREDLFITSKLWCTFHEHGSVRKALDISLQRLGLEYLDLYLVHWPIPLKEGVGDFPFDENEELMTTDTDYLETWKGMEELVDAGLVRSIGISNFNVQQTKRVLDNCRIKPAMQQVEIHPCLPNQELVDFCHSHGIAVTAYSSLGCPAVPDFVNKEKLNLLEDPVVKRIAEKHNKGANHVLLRYSLDRNICVIPKSVTPERIKDNFNLFDFKLDQEDLAALSNIGRSFRVVPFAFATEHQYHPFR